MKPLNQHSRRTGAGRSKPLEFVYRPIEQLKPDPREPPAAQQEADPADRR